MRGEKINFYLSDVKFLKIQERQDCMINKDLHRKKV